MDSLGSILFGLFLILIFIVIDYFIIRHIENKPTVYDGQIVITVLENSKKVFSLELSGDPEDLEQKESVTFKVVSEDILNN